MVPTGWMTSSSFLKVIFLLIGLFSLGTTLSCLDKEAFAKSLEQDKDWYRAITIRKEIRFDASDTPIFWDQTQQILQDLWEARQYQEGLNEITRLKEKLQNFPEIQKKSYIWAGLFQYKLGRYPSAEYFWTEADHKLYLGLLYLRTNRWAEGFLLWKEAGFNIQSVHLPETRQPVLAAGLSLAFPGAGQVYSGHWMDGAQALLFVSTMGLSTYCAYQYDSKVSGNYGLTAVMGAITLFFEASNVYGAYKTAEYFNENKRLRMMEFLEEKVFQQPLPQMRF